MVGVRNHTIPYHTTPHHTHAIFGHHSNAVVMLTFTTRRHVTLHQVIFIHTHIAYLPTSRCHFSCFCFFGFRFLTAAYVTLSFFMCSILALLNVLKIYIIFFYFISLTTFGLSCINEIFPFRIISFLFFAWYLLKLQYFSFGPQDALQATRCISLQFNSAFFQLLFHIFYVRRLNLCVYWNTVNDFSFLKKI